jgi:hypothetical protein
LDILLGALLVAYHRFTINGGHAGCSKDSRELPLAVRWLCHQQQLRCIVGLIAPPPTTAERIATGNVAVAANSNRVALLAPLPSPPKTEAFATGNVVVAPDSNRLSIVCPVTEAEKQKSNFTTGNVETATNSDCVIIAGLVP